MTEKVMPRDQAFQVAQSFLRSFSLPQANRNDWNKRNLGKQFSSEGFEASPVLNYYPVVAMAIASSQNKLYPWVVGLNIESGWREQRDWNEERVWRELPLPAMAAVFYAHERGTCCERA